MGYGTCMSNPEAQLKKNALSDKIEKSSILYISLKIVEKKTDFPEKKVKKK